MKIGDKVMQIGDNGKYFDGFKGEVIEILSNKHKNPVLVKSLYGQTIAWYSTNDLKVIENA